MAGIITEVSNYTKGIAGIVGGHGNQSGLRLISYAFFNMTGSGGFENAMVYSVDKSHN